MHAQQGVVHGKSIEGDKGLRSEAFALKYTSASPQRNACLQDSMPPSQGDDALSDVEELMDAEVRLCCKIAA